MNYQGVRRCDVCSSEMLGRGGRDICYLCQLLIEEDPDVLADDNLSLATTNVLIFPGNRARRPGAARKP